MSYLPELLLYGVGMSSSLTSSNVHNLFVGVFSVSNYNQTYCYWGDHVCLPGHYKYYQNESAIHCRSVIFKLKCTWQFIALLMAC